MENRTKRDRNIFNLVSDFEIMIASGTVAFMEEKSYQKIIDYYEDELQIDKALKAVEFALSQFKYRSDFYIIKAKLLFRKHQLDESLLVLDKAETVSPYESEIRILRARILGQKGELDQALKITQDLKIYATKSDLIEIYICESFLYELMHDYEEMFQALKRALIIDPINEVALERMWISAELSKNFEESILLHKVLLDKYPYNYLAWFNLGHAYACVGEYETAVDSLEYSFIINKNFEAGYLDCAEFCFQLKRYDQALSIYMDANEFFGPDSELQISIAHCQYLIGRRQEAEDNLKGALRIDPYNDEAFYLLARCHIEDKNWGAALNALNKAVDLDSEREEYYHCLARCFMNLGDFDNAKKHYRQAALTGLEQPIYWEEYISFLIKIGEITEASQVIQKAEQYTYSDKLIYCKSIILFKLNDRKEAIKFLEEALIENVDNFQFFYDLAPEFYISQDIHSVISYYLGENKYSEE